MGVAEFHETRAFSVFYNAALKRNGAQLIDLSAAWPHRACSLILPAHHNHTPRLNKTTPMVNCWLDFQE
jgi:hypothetical protein